MQSTALGFLTTARIWTSENSHVTNPNQTSYTLDKPLSVVRDDWMSHLPLLKIQLFPVDGDSQSGVSVFYLREYIAEGGMGIVHSAIQSGLDRKVAIKRLKSQNRPDLVMGLYREARIVGKLEHPDIPPIHFLGKDENGHPALIMKQIRGTSLKDIILDDAHPYWKSVSGDRLKWKLEIFLKICNAVSYAHSRGVLHRDIKSENVMVGEFGEVYLLDWGVAIEKNESNEYWPTCFSGTPAFAAPEMFREGFLTEQSDIYLLGAFLHEMITALPRHNGSSLAQVVANAMLSEPYQYNTCVDLELAEICNMATNKDPKQRYKNVHELYSAVQKYGESRLGSRVYQEALLSLEKLEKGVEQKSSESDLNELGIRARYAFEQAMRLGTNHAPTENAFVRCLETLLHIAIQYEDCHRAETLLFELRRNLNVSSSKLRELQDRVDVLIRRKKHFEEITTQIQYAMIEELSAARETIENLRAGLSDK